MEQKVNHSPYERTEKSINDLREYLHWNVFPHMLHPQRQEILSKIKDIETNLKNDYIAKAFVEMLNQGKNPDECDATNAK